MNKKIMFDCSVHLGQFAIHDEAMRKGCKLSQMKLSLEGDDEFVGFVTHNENTWADDIIWRIPREPQDMFYKFMDVFHTLKNAPRLELTKEHAEAALTIRNTFPTLHFSNALTCAVAIANSCDEIHTYYSTLLSTDVVSFMKAQHDISILSPSSEAEFEYEEKSQGDLEQFYQDALKKFRETGIDLVRYFHN